MKKILLVALAAILLLAATVWFGGRWYLARSVMAYGGEVPVAGLAAPVKITFDAKGIPQVWAENSADLYFAMGWLHAGERLFQMEAVRRLVYGELSDLLGSVTIGMDQTQRRLGFARRAAAEIGHLDEASLTVLDRYCAGVNAWIEQADLLPPEFVLLGARPRPWKAQDCLAIAYYQTWFAHALMDQDRSYNHLIKTLGSELGALLNFQKNWSPTTVPDEVIEEIFSGGDFPLQMSKASNSWVISPERSQSGAAIHASDPHLDVQRVPAFWYLIGLHAPGEEALGVSAPGMPMIAMGHNGHIAYAFTVAAVDVIDYYHFETDQRDSLKIRTADGWEHLKSREEVIPVKDAPEVRFTVLESSVGPVVDRDSSGVIALHWAGFDRPLTTMIASALSLQKAQNFEQFRRAVTGFGALDVNWTYSDRDGNIGYQLGAPVPIRTIDNTFELLDGDDAANQWQGYWELEKTPMVLNPAAGFVASCNNQVVSENWPAPIPGFYDPYRIVRITELLQGNRKFSAREMGEMQLDMVSILARRWKGLMAEGAERVGETTLAGKLRDWDARMAIDSEEAGLFMLWWAEMARAVFEDDLGEEGWREGRHILEEILSSDWHDIVDDQRSEAVEDHGDIAGRALQRVIERQGRPQLGEISTYMARHPLSQVDILDTWLNLNRGPFPVSGDKASLDANFNTLREKDGQVVFYKVMGPSMRFVLDWAAVDEFTINNNMGQSGNPFSPHYDDQLKLMMNGERWTVPFSRAAVEARAVSVVMLLP
ncbi:MAG: penicillin acylase family protein [Calditrichaeota bacterium]|nr:penicillin acylase family protein [Calditrichota bacterium]